MPDFEEVLKSSLEGVNEQFRDADAELHEAVAGASAVVEKLTNGQVALTLTRHSEDEDGVVYKLCIVAGKAPRGESVGAIKVPSGGYPILVAASTNEFLINRDFQNLPTPETIGKYLSELASNPDSPLVKKLAFVLRRLASLGSK